MDSRGDYAAAYAAAFKLRDEVDAFLLEIGVRRGWSLVSKIVSIRFNGALVAFLDAPTERHFAAVMDFQSEIFRIERSLEGNRVTAR